MGITRTHVDLFSGIGGFSLACEWAGVETIAFSEVDPYASRVLQRHWPHVRNYGDVRNFPSLSAWLLTAGVPCQPASVAGKRKGAADDRWLWPETLAVVENGAYEWLLFENPTGILSLNDGLEFERICAALEGKGYEVQPLVIPACGVRAKHRRFRVWILAHAERGRGRQSPEPVTPARQPFYPAERQEGSLEPGPSGENVADTNGSRPQGTREWKGSERTPPTGYRGSGGAAIRDPASAGLPDWANGEMERPWPLTEFERPSGREVERFVCRVPDGLSRGLDGGGLVEQVNVSETSTESLSAIEQILRGLRLYAEPSETPSRHQQAAGNCDSLSDVPHKGASGQQHMGAREPPVETVFGLRRNILSLEAQGQDLQQSGMPERAWTVSGTKAVAKRVDRLRCLGNAIVPQVAYQLIKRMIEAETDQCLT